MRQPYKLEVFDRSMTYRDFSVIERQLIAFDYLTLETTQITAPKLLVEKGDYVHITDSVGGVVHQGIVSDATIRESTVDLRVAPLLSLYDLTVSYDRRDLQNGALEDFIAGIIRSTYISNPDTLQNISGLTVRATSSTTGTALNIKSNVHEFYDIITKGFTMYGVVVSSVLLPGEGKIETVVGTVTPEPLIIESTLKNVVDKNFVIGDSYGQCNKITLINKNNEAEAVTYYLHPDGSIDTANANRITPVFPATEYVESDDFVTDSENRARENLSPQKYNNLIEITYRNDDRLIGTDAFTVGRTASIVDDQTYASILTGYELGAETIKLVFGNVRADLTKLLTLERRRTND